jgi:GxxExxY protein
MPIHVDAELRRMPRPESSRVTYEVMNVVFEVHNDLGRFFDEDIYRDEIARRRQGIRTEVLIEVTFRDFRKPYFMDLLIDSGFIFELKTVEKLAPRHRSQLLNYLLLTELPHGKLVNLRSELVEHEFVNTTLTRRDRTTFTVREGDWQEPSGTGLNIKALLVEMLRDWGVGLDLHLYEEALTHFLGGEDRVLKQIEIVVNGRSAGKQKVRLTSPDAAFKITALGEDGRMRFEDHARRFLEHTRLRAIHWINLTREQVLFRTLEKERTGR